MLRWQTLAVVAGAFSIFVLVLLVTAPSGKMPIHIGEHELGILLDHNIDGCSPHRGLLTQSGTRCVLHTTLEPGWHEIDVTKYDVETVDTRTHLLIYQ